MKTYIQIGSNVGKDDFQRMVESMEQPANIVLVEPNPNLTQELENNYKELSKRHQISIFVYGISNTDGESDLYFYWNHVLSSMIKRRTIAEEPARQIKIKTLTFEHLCELCKVTEVENLSIDTEGLDYQILMSIDLNKIKINEIIFEEWWPENDDRNGIYETGPSFLEKVKEKYKDYRWEKLVLENMQNYRLTKI